MIKSKNTVAAPTPKVKTCSVCGHTGPDTEFRENRRQCLPCSAKRSRASTARWNSNNKERVAKYDADRYAEKKEYYRLQNASYHSRHRERINARRALNAAKNLEHRKAYTAVYNKTPAGILRAKNGCATRRARLRNALRDVTTAELTALYASSANCCYCLRDYTEKNPKSADHILPLALGGAHTLSNLAICCRKCNSKKNAKTTAQWFAYLASQTKENPAPPPGSRVHTQ